MENDSLKDLESQFDEGELDMDDYISKRDEIVGGRAYGQGFEKSQNDTYVDNFINENPDYVDAFNSGKLEPWLKEGKSGEEAWDAYRDNAPHMRSRSPYEKQLDDAERLLRKMRVQGR